MRITFCGAARTVTGSRYLVEANGQRILVDCGMFQGNRETREHNFDRFHLAANQIGAVLLTHAHIDHSGLLPRLVREGFRGRILATEATMDLCGAMLPDSAHIQEMEAEWRGRKAKRLGREEPEALYSMADALATLELMVPVKYSQEIEVFPGLRARFLDAGHILGSAIIELWSKENGRETKVVFSGDLGQRGAPIIKDPTLIQETDYLLIESTYGDRLHEDIHDRRGKLAEVIKAAQISGGNLIIPAFAVERTQELLVDIKQIKQAGQIYVPPVFIDSPLAISATEIFRRHPDCYDEEIWGLLNRGESPFEFPGLEFTRTTEESQALNRREGGAIIISASGMCEAGRILHHLKHNLWRPNAHLLFVGFQAEGTLGRTLLDGNRSVRVMGEEIAVKATIHNLGSYSAHADRDGLLEWLGALKRNPRGLFLVHGEDEVLASWSETVRAAMGLQPLIPSYGQTYELGETAVLIGAEAGLETADDWLGRLRRLDQAYQGFRSRLPAHAPADSRQAEKMRRAVERILQDMGRIG